jgi:hypothetical protein
MNSASVSASDGAGDRGEAVPPAADRVRQREDFGSVLGFVGGGFPDAVLQEEACEQTAANHPIPTVVTAATLPEGFDVSQRPIRTGPGSSGSGSSG